MPAHNILIVDDQRDIRRLLRAALETLGKNIKVVDVPSGEEAILVVSRQPVELLISDIYLPGISGLELKERAEVRNPNLKFILVTGVADSDTRYEVAHCGADAYFYKPVEIADFLEAVKNCIGLNRPASSGKKTEQAEEAAAEEADFTVSDHLSKLRQKSGVECAVLIDEHGQVMAQAGNLPEDSNNPDFIISLMSAFSATSKVSYMFGREVPEDFLHVTGQSHSLLLTHVGPSMGLLLVQEISGKEAERLGKMLPMVRAAVEKLLTTLSQLGVPLGAPEEPQTDIQASTEEVTATEEAAPNLEAIFNPSGKKKLKAVDVDSFWELANQESVDNVSRADVISYEQARQLGLAPDEE